MKTPTINVNLQQCDSGCQTQRPGSKCYEHCAASPILIPCRIPRSVVFEVTVAQQCPSCGAARPWPHQPECNTPDALKPIRVSCSIGGDGTWAGSKVTDVEPRTDADGDDWGDAMWNACRDRWALVKALLLDNETTFQVNTHPIIPLCGQRDSVFDALADMARAEQAAYVAQNSALLAMGDGLLLEPYHKTLEEDRPSAWMLERYVGRLVEQIGVLP